MAEETDENVWKVGYLYRDPEHIDGEDPLERAELTLHHIWAPPAKPDRAATGKGELN